MIFSFVFLIVIFLLSEGCYFVLLLIFVFAFLRLSLVLLIFFGEFLIFKFV